MTDCTICRDPAPPTSPWCDPCNERYLLTAKQRELFHLGLPHGPRDVARWWLVPVPLRGALSRDLRPTTVVTLYAILERWSDFDRRIWVAGWWRPLAEVVEQHPQVPLATIARALFGYPPHAGIACKRRWTGWKPGDPPPEDYFDNTTWGDWRSPR